VESPSRHLVRGSPSHRSSVRCHRILDLLHNYPTVGRRACANASPETPTILGYVVAFTLGYREELFRELLKRVTDLLATAGATGRSAPWSWGRPDPTTARPVRPAASGPHRGARGPRRLAPGEMRPRWGSPHSTLPVPLAVAWPLLATRPRRRGWARRCGCGCWAATAFMMMAFMSPPAASWLNRSTDRARWPLRSPGWITSINTYWSLSGSSPSSSGRTIRSAQCEPSAALRALFLGSCGPPAGMGLRASGASAARRRGRGRSAAATWPASPHTPCAGPGRQSTRWSGTAAAARPRPTCPRARPCPRPACR
jgi:hypothetical protein